MRATILVPAPLSTVSGGYAYDRRMLAEWTKAGHHVAATELAGQHPLPDAQACAAAAQAWAMMQGTPIIDGLALPAFAAHAPDFAGRCAIGLIHHPVSMEAGTPEPDAARLREIEKTLFPQLAHIIVTSETTAATLVAEFAVPAEKITTVIPGTDPAPRSPGTPNAGGPGGPTCRIVALGSYTPRKGHPLLLRALARLFDLDWHLTIAGGAFNSPHAHELQALAEQLKIAQRVTLLGPLQDEALEALWASADFFALATEYEGYGMAIAEALKRGLPCAITKGGAAGKLVPPTAGAVCEVGDVVTYSKALRRLIFDTDMRAQMAEAALAAGEALPSWEAQARLFADVVLQ